MNSWNTFVVVQLLSHDRFFGGPHGLQHARLPCPSLSPGVCSSLYPLSQWCYSTILSSVTPFSSFPQSLTASGSFPVSRLFQSDGQSIGASSSVLLMNIQGWFPLRLTGLISLLSKGLSRVFYNTTVRKHPFFSALPSLVLCRPYGPALTCVHDYWKDHSLDYTDLWWMCRETLIHCWKKCQMAYPLGEKAHGSL